MKFGGESVNVDHKGKAEYVECGGQTLSFTEPTKKLLPLANTYSYYKVDKGNSCVFRRMRHT